jgi:hypothetical protein
MMAPQRLKSGIKMILRGQFPASAFPEFYRRLLFAGAAVTSTLEFPDTGVVEALRCARGFGLN